ncbi:MAG: hypothetical protein KQI35_00180 [Bacteroidetes bacterium]|nr:hypothetical protein [Bacteroidota bacterium]
MKLLTTILLISLSTMLVAQYERTAIGLRAGGVSGFSFKHIDESLTGVEVVAGWQENGFRLVGMIQKYKPIATHRLANLFMFTGFGAHSGYIRHDRYSSYHEYGVPIYSGNHNYSPVLGGDFILGLEYHFESIPLNFSVDYKPYFQLFGEEHFRLDLWDLGFTVRYALNN